MFIGHLIDNKRQSTTIHSYISAIKFVLCEDGIKIHEDQFLIASLTRACKLLNDSVHCRLPIHKDMLLAVLWKVDYFYLWVKNQPKLALLYKTLFSTAYVGELTKGEHPILARDIHIAKNKKKMLFILCTSKTHWKSDRPQMVKISSMSSRKCAKRHCKVTVKMDDTHAFCPYYLLQSYMDEHGQYLTPTEPFFIFTDRSPVKPEQMRSCLKKMINLMGLDSRLYSVHSLRAGRSSDLLNCGVSVETIKKLGHWKSNAVFRYLC